MDWFKFWQKWLVCAFVLQIILGVGFVVLGQEIVFWKAYEFFNQVLWGTSTLPETVRPFHDWISGVLGATIAGWALSMIFVVQNSFKRRETWAWNCVGAGVALWFILDTAITLKFGVWPNTILNILSLGMLALPLVFTRKYFDAGIFFTRSRTDTAT